MILLTGGTGMLGSYLLLQLTQEHTSVRALKRTRSSTLLTQKIFHHYLSDAELYLNRIEWIDADLLSYTDLENKCNEITEIYHCAAHISYQAKEADKMIQNNQTITKNLVNIALAKKISKFCFVSSIAALGNSDNNEHITENTFWKDTGYNSSYSISKHLSEMEVWRGMAEGLNAVIINPSVILGIGLWNSGSSNIFKTIHKRLRFYTLGTTGFVDVKDVVQSMILLMQCGSCFGNRYVINAENRSYKDIFYSMAQKLNVKPPSIYATSFLTEIAWRWAFVKGKIYGKAPLITKQSAKIAHKKLHYSSAKLLNDLPSFHFTSIDQSIDEYTSAFLQEESLR